MQKEEINYMVRIIVDSVPCIEAAHAMGIKTDNQGRCACFIHGGSHKNLKFYDGNRGYYCFVCHAFGNVIDLVMNYQKAQFMEAVEWINDTFSLGFNFGGKAQRMSTGTIRSRYRKVEAHLKNAKART